ncbi:MAG: hypothetical protein ABFD16_21130, partial [Thermoguttaceae bacterium]
RRGPGLRPRGPRILCLLTLCLAVSSGCLAEWTNRLKLPAEYTLNREQLVFHSDFPLASQHRLIEELVVRRLDLQQRLGVPLSDEPIEVYLFENGQRFDAFLRLYHPQFPARRAFFLETDTRLVVYAQWGDRVAEDLRHEVTHGYLHAVVPSLPLWLDEGLAEFSEVPRGARGLHRQHVAELAAAMQRHQWRPDLMRLEALEPDADMTQEEYAEAWAWVHLLLETPLESRNLLPVFLADIRHLGATEPLSVRLRQVYPDPEAVLVDHLRRLIAMVKDPSRNKLET